METAPMTKSTAYRLARQLRQARPDLHVMVDRLGDGYMVISTRMEEIRGGQGAIATYHNTPYTIRPLLARKEHSA